MKKKNLHYIYTRIFCRFIFQKQNDVTKVALPRIGCGLDGLEWDKVKDILHEVFGNESVEIVVYNYSAQSSQMNKKFTNA